MPIDVQWFIYALVSNQVVTVAGARELFNSLGPGADLATFAQAILEQLVADLSEDEAEATLNQIQEVVNYAVAQAETGTEPPELPEEAPAPVAPTPEPAPVAAATPPTAAPTPEPAPATEAPPAAGAPPAPGDRSSLVSDSSVVYPEVEIDPSTINSYEDLPSLSDASQLSDEELEVRMIYLLSALRILGCSDFHVSGGAPAFVRRQLQIERIDSYVITAEEAKRLNTVLLSPERKAQFERDQDINFSLEIGRNRFRVCLMQHKDGMAGSYRLVPDHISKLEDLGFLEPDAATIRRLLDYHNGLVLVTGPIGSGKTTTLASMVDVLNDKRQDHIITVEEPIEILQFSRNCQITQREIGKHTLSYHAALKAALREDPDIIEIGEMHDLETIENAITASETGHLVIGTLHTGDAANTLNRLLDVFPPSQQAQIRAMTAGSLRGIICQKLIPNGFGGIELVYEILINSMAVSNIINDGKTYQLKSTMSTGSKQGMCTIDQCIFNKYLAGLLTYEAAKSFLTDRSVIEQIDRDYAIKQAQQLK